MFRALVYFSGVPGLCAQLLFVDGRRSYVTVWPDPSSAIHAGCRSSRSMTSFYLRRAYWISSRKDTFLLCALFVWPQPVEFDLGEPFVFVRSLELGIVPFPRPFSHFPGLVLFILFSAVCSAVRRAIVLVYLSVRLVGFFVCSLPAFASPLHPVSLPCVLLSFLSLPLSLLPTPPLLASPLFAILLCRLRSLSSFPSLYICLLAVCLLRSSPSVGLSILHSVLLPVSCTSLVSSPSFRFLCHAARTMRSSLSSAFPVALLCWPAHPPSLLVFFHLALFWGGHIFTGSAGPLANDGTVACELLSVVFSHLLSPPSPFFPRLHSAFSTSFRCGRLSRLPSFPRSYVFWPAARWSRSRLFLYIVVVSHSASSISGCRAHSGSCFRRPISPHGVPLTGPSVVCLGLCLRLSFLNRSSSYCLCQPPGPLSLPAVQ